MDVWGWPQMNADERRSRLAYTLHMWNRLQLSVFALLLCVNGAKAADVFATILDPSDAGVTVSAELRGASTYSEESSDSGGLHFTGIPAGNYILWLKCPGFQTKVVRVLVPESMRMDLGRLRRDLDLGFQLEPPSEIGRPGADISVNVEPSEARWSLRCTTRRTCGRDHLSGVGSLNLNRLRPGRYELKVTAKRYFASGQTFELADGFAYKFQVGLLECIDARCKKIPVYL
ncbi:MAG: hypothetical protein RL328_1409 [Acidobacteriota bacterium]